MIKKTIAVIFLGIILINHVVFADDELEEEGLTNFEKVIQSSSEAIEEPIINSRAAVVFDRNTGAVLFGKNENTRKKMASTTKIMTAVIVIENADLNKTIEVSKKAARTGGSRLRIIYRS